MNIEDCKHERLEIVSGCVSFNTTCVECGCPFTLEDIRYLLDIKEVIIHEIVYRRV